MKLIPRLVSNANIKRARASLYIGFFLAVRDIRRGNIWTTSLIIFVMGLTFFNMLLIGGILLGLAEGVASSYKDYYSSDVLITPVIEKNSIEQTGVIMKVVNNLPSLDASTQRFTLAATVEHGYKTKLRKTDITDSVAGTLMGIDPKQEDKVTKLSTKIIEGEYLTAYDADSILLGKDLLARYSNLDRATDQRKLVDVYPGTIVRLNVNGVQKEVTVKGIIETDNGNIDNRIFMIDSDVRALSNNTNLDASEIAIKLQDGASDVEAKKFILGNISNADDVLVRTADEAVPAATVDIKKTFSLLGNLVGVIALIVGAITIFIVIFVNAITRRKYIGILKGIGISPRAIQLSYVFQSFFYATGGILFGSIIIMYYLKPYFDINPIEMPITEGGLAITYLDLFIRGAILLITALISGFIPAWIVTRQNTLDSILGR